MAQFGNTNITAVGTDAFVAKMKPDGTVSWVNSVGSPVGTAVVTIAVAKRDDLIIGGGVQISASFGSTNIYGPSFFLCRYDSAGETRWLVATSGVRSAQVSGVAVDANDNLLAVGGFSGPIVIGDTTLQHSLNSSGLFLAKYNPAGQVVWARTAGEGDVFAGRIALDPRGYIAVAARFGNDGYTIGDDVLGPHSSSGTYSFVSRFTPEGIPLWARQFGGAGSTFSGCNGLCADRSGNIYATGYFSGTATFGSHLISGTVFDYHVYLIKYDSSGDLQWVRANGGEGGSNMSAVSLDENDQIFWAGLFSSSIEIGDITVTASNAEPSLFVSRLQLNAKLSSRAEMGKLVLDWPTNLTDFTLQSAADPTTHELWKPVPLEPIRSGNRFVITNSLEESNLFFRLESR